MGGSDVHFSIPDLAVYVVKGQLSVEAAINLGQMLVAKA